MTDERIAMEHGLYGLDSKPRSSVLSALAAARADQHAECVRMLRLFDWHDLATWLESHAPKADKP